MIDLVQAYRRLDGRYRDRLRQQGVPTEAMLMWPGPIGIAWVETHELGIFDFSDAGQLAFVHPIYSGGFGSEVIDVAAWLPSDPSRWWTHNYSGWAIGDDQLFAAELQFDPILLHPCPLNWLAANGVGVVVMDWIMSGAALRSIQAIVVEDQEFGLEVERRLTMPVQHCPEIRVRRAAA